MTNSPFSLADYLVNFGIEIGKELIKKKYDEIKLRERLTEYISKQEEYNKLSDPCHDIDFQGLIEYFCNHLLDDVRTNIYDNDPNRSEKALKNIIEKAIAYAKADTPEKKQKIEKIISDSLCIIKTFYRDKIDEQYYILADDIKDSINSHTDEVVTYNFESLNQKIDSIFTFDSLVSQIAGNDIPTTNKQIETITEQLSKYHPLKPYYGYKIKDDHLISKPLIPEATKRYPITYRINGTLRIGNELIVSPSTDILKRAYRQQKPLVMKVEESAKYLGDTMDPVQSEAEELIGKEVYAIPPKFPPAFACSISVKGEVFFKYILLRIQEIQDDGTYILNNSEQNTHFKFEIRFNINALLPNTDCKISINPRGIGFSYRLSNPTHEEILVFLRFIKKINTEKELQIHHLEQDQDILSGMIDCPDYHSDFNGIDEEIDFLERICSIEKFFNVELSLVEGINKQDYDTVLLVSELIQNDSITKEWDNVTFDGVVDDGLRKLLANIGDGPGQISCIGTYDINLFGEHIKFECMRTFSDAIIDDRNRIIKLLELTKNGDPIKIPFHAGENNQELCTLHIPNNT